MTCYKKKELQREEVTERRIVSIQESGFFAPSRDIYLDKQTKSLEIGSKRRDLLRTTKKRRIVKPLGLVLQLQKC